MLKDSDMRQVLINKIEQQNNKCNYRIIPEMSVCDGKSRVDIAVANGKLYGYEIKSDADTLDRLATQMECYNKTFDRMVIAVGEKYENVINEHISSWWGIYVIKQRKSGELYLVKKRAPKANPDVDASSLLELLWRDEIYCLLKSNGIKGLSGKNRRVLRRIAYDTIPHKIIQDYCRETLKHRLKWRE